MEDHGTIERSADVDLPRRILDCALDEAEQHGWDRVRLRNVAGKLGVSLADINRHYRDLDAVADEWFRQAWQAMLAPVPAHFDELPPHERIQMLMLRWFHALAPHRQVTVDMLKDKLWPFHPHHWVPMIFNLSRTIIWIRDAAALDADGLRRAIEEVGMTWLFLATLLVWAGDNTPNSQRMQAFLSDRLIDADRILRLLHWSKSPNAAAVN